MGESHLANVDFSRRPGIQHIGILLLVALPLVSVHSQSTEIGHDHAERIVSPHGLLQDKTVGTVVNKHAVLKVQVSINSTSMDAPIDTFGPNGSEAKWSVVLDEVDASDSNSMVHLVQPIHLEWSSSPHQGFAELSFVVPASVSRSFLLSLLEGQRLVTRRLANVHATKKLEDSGGSPVVSVYLEGTTHLRHDAQDQTHHSISLHFKLVAFLLFALWIFRSLLVASAAQLLHRDPSTCDQDDDVGFDGSAFILHSTDYQRDSDDMTDDPGCDDSESSGPSRRLGFSHLADHSNDDDSMMPPTVFRFKVDPSRFDHLTVAPSLGPQLKMYHEEHLTDTPDHPEMMQPFFEETRHVRMVEINDCRDLPVSVQEDSIRQQLGKTQTKHRGICEVLPFTEPIPKSHVTCLSSHEIFTAQELAQEAISHDMDQRSQVSEDLRFSISTELIAAGSSVCSIQPIGVMSDQKRLLVNSVAGEKSTEKTTSEISNVGASIRESLVTAEAPIDSIVRLHPRTATLELGQGFRFETDQFTASPSMIADVDTTETWRIPEPVQQEHIVETFGNGSHSSHLPVPCEEVDAKKVPSEPASVFDIDGTESNDLKAELMTDGIENRLMPRRVEIEASKPLPASGDNPSLKATHIPVESNRIDEAASPTLPFLISSSAQPRNGKRRTRREPVTKRSPSEEQSSIQSSASSNNSSQENVDPDDCWLQRLSRPSEATQVTRKSGQRLLRLEKEAIPLSVIATGPPSVVMASGPLSQVEAFKIITPEAPQRVDIENAGVTSASNWFQRLRTRSQTASTHCGKAFVPNSTEMNGDDFSYVSTLAPDSDAASNPDAFDADDTCSGTLRGKVHRQLNPRSAKRKREYGGICARIKSPIEKVKPDVFAELTCLGPSNYNNEVVHWEPTQKERSSLPRARKKRRALASIANALPDAMPSAMVVAKEVNAPVWEFKEVAVSYKC
ncbi:hypothetical protein MHU86_9321 [Fragilaria crotonensis]|nr:hypothetical protein MHU86_9321 [Fragilaria crotonensis]